MSVAEVKCNECAKYFPKDELIKIGSSLVCATCKPIAIQKTEEGVLGAGAYEKAGWWIRFWAKIIDSILLQVVTFFFMFLAGITGNQIVIIVMTVLFSYIVPFLYNIYFLGKSGATLGKKWLKIKVIRMNGEPLTYGRATGRAFAEILSSIIVGFGYIMAAFDKEYGQTLHDKICDTRVIRDR